MLDSFGTAKIHEDKIKDLIRAHFSLKPKAMISALNLLRPSIERPPCTAISAGRAGIHLEKTDKADALRRDAGLR